MNLLLIPIPHAPVTLLRLEGRLDWAAGASVERFAEQRRNQRSRERRDERGLVLDLGALEFCDSLGLGVLVALAQNEHEAGGELVVCNLRPAVRRTLEAVRLHEFFMLFDDTDSALRWLMAGHPAAQPDGDVGSVH